MKWSLLLLTLFCLACQYNAPDRNMTVKVEAGNALDYFYYSRSYPEQSFNMDQFTNEYQKYIRNKITNRTTPIDSWAAMGPMNYAGRCLEIQFNNQNPNTIFVGTAGAGLWKSYTAGVGPKAWHHVATGYPVLSVSCMAIHPTDSNTLYIGTGEVYNYGNVGTGHSVWRTRGSYGIGILKSTDGGTSWKPSLDWSREDLRGVNKIIIDYRNATRIIAGTSEGIFISEDDGRTWKQSLKVINVTDLIQKNDNPDIMVAAAGNLLSRDGGIYKSLDGGVSWTKSGIGFPTFNGKVMLTKDPSNSNRILASVGSPVGNASEIQESNNFGDQWQSLGAALRYTYYWIAHDISVHPGNPYDILCGGVEVFKFNRASSSLERRSQWNAWYYDNIKIGGPEGDSSYVHADIHDIIRHPNNPDVVYLATDGGVFRTLNNGVSFEGCNGLLQTVQFYQSCSNSSQDSNFFIGGLQDNATAVYEGKPEWRRVIGGDGGFTCIDPTNDQKVYGSIYWLAAFRSIDRAKTFQYIFPQQGANNANFIAPICLCESEENILATSGDTFYLTENGGASWTKPIQGSLIDSGRICNTLSFAPSDCNYLYASTTPFKQGIQGAVIRKGNAQCIRSKDKGRTWTNIQAGIPNRIVMDFAVDPNIPQRVFAVCSGFGTPHVFFSEDAGLNWFPLTNGLPDVPFNSITIDPFQPEHIYAGSDLGVWFSSNSGKDWESFNEGLVEACLVMDLSISKANKKLRIGTHGRGMFERSLVSSFVSVASENIKQEINLFSFYPNPVKDYILIKSSKKAFSGSPLVMCDVLGHPLKTIKLQEGEQKIDLANFLPGIYWLILRNGGLSQSEVFTIQ
ncbi:MAG: T9SS type A sorting domain-containing protein [Saprospiraceae bacterium]|nr:T9SS type A sorting domain-containing protein [Saprospiraceae bacterium]